VRDVALYGFGFLLGILAAWICVRRGGISAPAAPPRPPEDLTDAE
jgi:hypothetical protein